MIDYRQAILTLSQQSPDSFAVIDQTTTLTRAELAARAGGVAKWVADLPDGTGTARIIAVLAPAGAVQIGGMLGVSAAGAAFMPIDPQLPQARIKAMLERAAPVGVLYDDAQGELISQLAPQLPRAALQHIDPAPLVVSSMRPDAAAYVMFTSGSTGTPKGILGRYKSLNHFLNWQADTFALDHSMRSAQLAPVTFDVSLRDVLLPLALGGVVTVPPPDLLMAPRKLLQWLRLHQVTLLHCVPSVLRLLTAELGSDDQTGVPDLQHLFLAGEPLLGRDIKNWRAVAGTGAVVVNLYGPSETTLAKVFAQIGLDHDLPDGMLPIGTALPDTDVLILKPDRLAVTGEIGEICIRTGFPSLGYLNDIEATRAGFQRNPFGVEVNDILYRSGDMGRLRQDGQIECLGRRDSQVKIAGNRVEGAEVEAALRGLAAVTDCVVVINRDDPTDPFLIGYVTGDGTEPESDSIRGALSMLLPGYMVPRFIVVLPVLPVLMNGKVDKRALPKPASLVHGASGPLPAKTPTETRVAAIWRDILGIDEIGVETPFANMGGDSLKAIKVLGDIYRAFGTELRIADFFAARTIRAIAAILDEIDGETAVVASIHKAPALDHDPLSDAQEPLWAMQQLGIDASVYNLCFGFRADGQVDLGRLERAFDHLIQSHEILRTQIKDIEGSPRQIIAADVAFRIEKQQLPDGLSAEEAAARLLGQERQRAFDLSLAPLVRVVAAQQANAGATFLVISFHHAVCDGHSLDIIVKLLGEAYASDAPLPKPELQYRDVIAWQTDRLSGQEADRLSDYWKRHLNGAPRSIDLPEAHPRPARQQFKGATLRHDLPDQLGVDLMARAQANDTSLFNTLLTGLAITLDQRSDQPDMVIATPVLGRNHPDLADQIGFFANTLCLRVRLDRDATLTKGLADVTQLVHAALDHQDWPFNRLVADQDEPRDLSRNPICNVMLVLFDADRPELNFPGLDIAPFGRDTEWAFSRFDLVFHVTHDSRTGALVLDLNHDTALFDRDQIQRIAQHFQTILEQIADPVDLPIAALTPHTPAQTALLAGLDRAEFGQADTTLTALFAKSVKAGAENVAVKDAQTTLSYEALDHWANGIAASLINHGAKAGSIIAVSGVRSAAGVAAILGVLKAGGAWVALDERWPLARRQTVLHSSDALLCLDAGAEPQLPEALWVHDIAPSPIAIDRALPDGLAYVVFTSGSTGTPKGVMIEHRGVSNMLHQQISTFDVTPNSRFLQFAAPVFDAHVSEVFMTLLAGGQLIVPTQETLENPAALKSVMAECGVTHATFPPSFLDVVQGFLPPTLEVLITAGEAARLGTLAALHPNIRLFNAYGPAENSVCSTIYEIDAKATDPVVPIGYPIDGTGLSVKDGSGRVVPMGVPGQIILHGMGLARGYIGIPDQLEAGFIEDGELGMRTYATGDIGALNADGAVVFLGRGDDQVKISGQRVEIREVETCLNNAPDVARAIVSPITGAEGRTTLGAWLLKKPGQVSLWPSVAEFFVYDDVVYQAMAGDRSRNARYQEGFERHLPGQTVLEVGPGPYAVLARMAIQAGARHVYAVEINPVIADRARESIASAGLQDRITVLTGDAASIVLPEQVDWCISEIVGGIGGSEGAAAILNAVRGQLAKPENMLPRRSVTRIAAIELPLSRIEPGFSNVAADYVDRIFEQRGRPFDLRLCLRRFDQDLLLSSSDVFEDLDFTTEMALESTHDIRLDIQREGGMTGFVVWLTMDVGANRSIDVLNDTASWLPVYVPIGPDGVTLCQGDEIRGRITRTLDVGGRHPDFVIDGHIMRQGKEVATIHQPVPHMSERFGDSPLSDHLFEQQGKPRIINDNFLENVRHHASDVLPRYAVPGILREIETLPRTINGKLATAELPALISQDQPVHEASHPEASDLALRIAKVFSQLLNRDSVDPSVGFFELGGDSILAVRAVGALATQQIEVNAAEILQHQSALALALVARVPETKEPLQTLGPVRAHPIQAWYLARDPQMTKRFHQSVVLTLSTDIDLERLEVALQTIMQRHGALRLKLDPKDLKITETDYAPERRLLVREDLRELSLASQDKQREKIAEQTHAEINPRTGHLFAARLFQYPDRQDLLLVAHHLGVDLVSWQIMLSELSQLLSDLPVSLPRPSTSYAHICAALSQEATSPITTTEKPYWDNIAHLVDTLSLSSPAAVGTMMQIQLDVAGKDADFGSHRSDDMQGVLLSAMAHAATHVLGWSKSVIDLETHGRDLPRQVPDTSGVVGWFTRITPVVVSAQTNANPLSELPRGGLGFGLLSWARDDHKELRKMQPALALNYLGDLSTFQRSQDSSAPFAVNWEGLGEGIDPTFRTGHALSVLAHLTEDGLFVSLNADLSIISKEDAVSFGNALRDGLLKNGGDVAPLIAAEFDLDELAEDLGL
ncbi:MAG: amino acid adenylation domain-containing protein [Sulfitobacter sp.]